MIFRSTKTSARNRFITVFIGASLFAALWIWSEMITWDRLVQSMNSRLIETAHAIALHTDDVFALAEQPLTDLALRAEASLGDEAATRQVIHEMRRMMRTTHILESISYFGADGQLIDGTQTPNPVGANISSTDYFRFHNKNASSEIHIGTVSRGQKGEGWFLPISRRINSPEGQFAGVIVTTVALDHLERFMQSFNLGGDSAFFLMRPDGGVILRFPFKPKAIAAGLGDPDFFRNASLTTPEGNHEFDLPENGMTRVSGFVRSEQTGVTAIAMRSKAALFHFWVQRSKYPWLGMLVAYIGALALAVRWMRQSHLRELGEQRIAAREAEFRLIANASTDVIEKISLTGVREYVSPAAAKIFEQSAESLIGTNVLDNRDEQTRIAWESALGRLQSGSTAESILHEHSRADGTRIWLESAISCVQGEDDDEPDGIVVITRDVTRQQKMKQELDALATTDELTRLFNKRHFNAQLHSMLTAAQANHQPLSLVLIDLDRFKVYNDTYGHLAGDSALRDVAAVIKSQMSGIDGLAARYGGEELVVLLPNKDAGEAHRIAEAIREAVASRGIAHAENLPWGHVTISSGYATALPDQAVSENDLIAKADRALYMAKTAGRNRSEGAEEETLQRRLRASA